MPTGRAPLAANRWPLLYFVLLLSAAIPGGAATFALRNQGDFLTEIALGLVAVVSLIGIWLGTRVLAHPYRTIIIRGEGADRGLRRAGWSAHLPIAYAIAFLGLAAANHFNVV